MNTFEQQIETITTDILKDYDRERDIDKVAPMCLPDKQAVADLTARLIRIIFPGYCSDRAFGVCNRKNLLSVLIEEAIRYMSAQITRVLQASGISESQAQKQSEQITLSFFGSISAIRAKVQTDVQAAFDGDPAASGKDEIIFAYPGLYAITVYRLAHELYLSGVPMLPRMMTEQAHSVTGIDIHPGARIGQAFFIDHGTGIVIGQTTVIGDRVKIYQGVTLGGLSTRGGQSLRDTKRHPTIEDDVTIYAGATILGGRTVIGQGCVICANAFITQSVAPYTRVNTETPLLQYKAIRP